MWTRSRAFYPDEPGSSDRSFGPQTQVWQALVDGDAAVDEVLIYEGFIDVYPSCFATCACHVGLLVDRSSVASFSIMEPRATHLGLENALLVYRTEYSRPDSASEAMHVSSIWQRIGPYSVNVLGQDTPAE